MDFCVFALSTLPDVTTARRVLELDGLDDKSVSKVLFHRRKQQTGRSDRLRWDQRMIGAMTLIRHFDDTLSIDAIDIAAHSEREMLRALHGSLTHGGRAVFWDDGSDMLALLRFRMLLHGLPVPRALRADVDDAPYRDLAAWLSAPDGERATLDGIARKLGLPGLQGAGEDNLVSAWLAGEFESLCAHSDLQALNSYLLALRLFHACDEMSGDERERAEQQLRDRLGDDENRRRARFLSAWGTA